MLHEFLSSHQDELIDRCRTKVLRRRSPAVSEKELEHGIPLFLEQLVRTLRIEQTADPMKSRKVSGPSGGAPVLSEIGSTAARHGRELLQHGFTVDQVVHDYGDLCQAITEIAGERGASIGVDEFRTLNRCLDNAIADAVVEFGYQRDALAADREVVTLSERLGSLAHELRNLIQTATLAVAAIKHGQVGLSGATGGLLDRSLVSMRNLIDRSIADIRAVTGTSAPYERLSVADFIADVEASSSLEAKHRGCVFTVLPVDPRLAIAADREMLHSAVANLVHNAFKFTLPHSEVTLTAYASGDRIRIDVADHCGGLPSGDTEALFLAFTQTGTDRTGLGLGLSIARRNVEANNGSLDVRDVPGSGCIFTIDLPRHAVHDVAVPKISAPARRHAV